ncbi:UPF0431 protein C1orf66 like protein [Trachymyrmex septentrionalis]|uniref:UPF0431 protein C1orf66 like protein n=1 Tax=Trachymyrmex septentrionalis TaxID=34720 RepID=A0A195FKC3_9HYME|nr:UPF0431 protein C1orf66 like protein [Trachymyrmex septentrionalis]
MTEYNQHFEKALEFINTYQELIDCHLVDFITKGLWDKCLPEKLRSELENIDMNDNIWAENNIDSELSNFIQLTKSLSLESCPAVICVNDLPKLLPQSSTERLIESKFVYPKSELMNTKKSHEIEMLGKVITEIALSTRSLVIDAGAGKAYLSTYLSEHFNIPVLAIDSSQVCHKGAINRQEKIQKRKRTLTKIRYIVQELDDTTNYNKVVNTCYPDWSVNGNLILTGLHTCGMLVHSVIKAFLHAKDINLLLVVPCCYHLANETLSGRWNFSKNARMLAQQSIERSRYNKHLSPSLFYRAVLQIILHSMGQNIIYFIKYMINNIATMQMKMIYHVCEPNPYHMSCNISNKRPSIIVCLLPSVLIKGPNTICAPTLKMPTTAINIATMRLEKPIANFKAANGSACSHDIGAGGRVFSGKLSGTATNMKNTSKTAIAVANATARFSP